jgi:cullin 3
VLHKHGDLLYDGVREAVTHRLMSTAIAVNTAADDKLLEVCVEQWEHHKLMMSMIRDILMYMVCIQCNDSVVPLTLDAISSSM